MSSYWYYYSRISTILVEKQIKVQVSTYNTTIGIVINWHSSQCYFFGKNSTWTSRKTINELYQRLSIRLSINEQLVSCYFCSNNFENQQDKKEDDIFNLLEENSCHSRKLYLPSCLSKLNFEMINPLLFLYKSQSPTSASPNPSQFIGILILFYGIKCLLPKSRVKLKAN